MGFKYSTEDTPDFRSAPKGKYDLTIESLSYEGGTDEDLRPLTVIARMRIDEPRGQRGLSFDNRFWLGTVEDPKCEKPSTRASDDWTRFKSMFRAAELRWTGDLDDDIKLLTGQKVTAYVGQSKSKAGKFYNKVWTFYRLGTVTNLGPIEDTRGNGLDTEAPRTFASEAATRSLFGGLKIDD